MLRKTLGLILAKASVGERAAEAMLALVGYIAYRHPGTRPADGALRR